MVSLKHFVLQTLNNNIINGSTEINAIGNYIPVSLPYFVEDLCYILMSHLRK